MWKNECHRLIEESLITLPFFDFNDPEKNKFDKRDVDNALYINNDKKEENQKKIIIYNGSYIYNVNNQFIILFQPTCKMVYEDDKYIVILLPPNI